MWIAASPGYDRVAEGRTETSNRVAQQASSSNDPVGLKIEVRRSDDVSRVRSRLRRCAQELGFSELVQTRIVTAASELARNLLQYAGSGEVRIETLRNGSDIGLRVSFEDKGPGIADVSRALADGFSSSGGLGLGLGGARRLMDDFEISSPIDGGTRIVITQWRGDV